MTRKRSLLVAIATLAVLPLRGAAQAPAAQGTEPASDRSAGRSAGPDRGDAIVASGVLAGDKDCQVLRTPSGETYVLLGQLPRTTAGDRVRVSGRRGGKSACQEGPTILVESMRLEGYEPAARQPGQPAPRSPGMVSHGPGPMDDARAGNAKMKTKRLQVTGTLAREGTDCPILRTPKGRSYTLAGDLKGFQTGARVTITGTQAQASICQQGLTIEVENVRRAPSTRR